MSGVSGVGAGVSGGRLPVRFQEGEGVLRGCQQPPGTPERITYKTLHYCCIVTREKQDFDARPE